MSPYIVKSLELHLFFGRIMKEHALFLRAGFTPAGAECAAQAETYLREFEEVLRRAVTLSEGVVGGEVLCSGELVTEFTAKAEEQTQCLTGIAIDQEITQRELDWNGGVRRQANTQELGRQVRQLNRRALKLLDGLICFKESILQKVLCGELFTANYPLLIEHIIREAKLYRRYLEILERDGTLCDRAVRQTEEFWNRIMMEHALFIRGLLDP